MSTYLEICLRIMLYVGLTIGAVVAVIVAFSAIGFIIMGIINLVDEFRS